MPSYTIVPRGRGYWIEATDERGSRRSLQRFDTEAEAVQRLHAIQEKAGIVPGRRKNFMTAKDRR